jgi:hypothetical protein
VSTISRVLITTTPATGGEPFITKATIAALQHVPHARHAFPRRKPTRVAARP